MVIGACKIDFIIPRGTSLKDKRQVIQKIKDKVKNKFNVSIAEVANQEFWQKATLGISLVSDDGGYVRTLLDKIINFIDNLYVAQILNCEIELFSMSENQSIINNFEGNQKDVI